MMKITIIDRRQFLQSVESAVVCTVAGGACMVERVNAQVPAVAATRPLATSQPLSLGGQRHMFIDEMLIAEMKGITFQVRPPDIRETDLTPDHPRQVLSGYSSVIDDGKELKMYYSTLGPLTVRLATSNDGIHWVKPELEIHNLGGSKKNNILFDYTINGSAYYDEHDPDPARRYKYFTCPRLTLNLFQSYLTKVSLNMEIISQSTSSCAMNQHGGPRRTMFIFLFAFLITAVVTQSEDLREPVLKTEHFDRDPGWEGHNNRIVPKKALMVKQDFGYSATHFAGKTAGELGGVIQRSTTPASYAAPLMPAKTLDNKLTASGTFAFTASQPGAGVFFGFFNSKQPGGSGRPIGSLGLNLDFEKNGGRLAVRLITANNQGCGTFITKYEQYRKPELKAEMRPTPISSGTRYTWQLDYDPDANKGDGRFQFTIKSNSDQPQDWEGQVFAVDVPPGYKKDGTSFDRFGVMNMMKAGGAATIFFDDLQYDRENEDFSRDPEWIGSGNRASFEDRELVGAHDFGFSAKTNLAGGSAGEIGGGLWRSGDFGYYADRVGPLNLEQRLEARGKVKLIAAGPDADMFIGWFNSASQQKSPVDEGNFVGIHVGGPTRVGHYFIPRLVTAKGTNGKVDQGPVLKPGKFFDWSLIYDPAANNGNGEMQVTLGKETVTLALKPGQKAQGASLDRFGLFTSQAGGQMVKIYIDDLKYTVSKP